ncbi:MAG TPA: UbiA family prenyltransferase [Candidatus Dormibacteraeota bacterium]
MVELIHPGPSLATAAVATAFGLLLGLPAGDHRLPLVGGIILLTQVSISALNEWADAHLDAAANRPRPIPLGLVTRRTALLVAIASGLAALAANVLAQLGVPSLLLIVLGLACGWIYDIGLKRTPLSFVPFAIAFPAMAVWVGVIAHPAPTRLPLILFGGVPLALAIHLADAIPDRDGDRTGGIRTLAVALGFPTAELVAAGGLVAGCLVAAWASTSHGRGVIGLPFVLLATAAYVVLNLSHNRAGQGTISLARWVLIGSAIAVAIWLVASA